MDNHVTPIEWISVAERLPELGEGSGYFAKRSAPVLITDGKKCAVAYWSRGFNDAATGKPHVEWSPVGVGHYGNPESRGETLWVALDPTHWMPLPPLPEPPKT